MRKLTKQSLDEMARTMNVIPESELYSVIGAYNNDCFWRCYAYMNNGGNPVSEAGAAVYAYNYIANVYGYTGINNLSLTNDASMTIGDIQKFIAYETTHGNYLGGNSNLGYIAVFNTNYVSNYAPGNSSHAVIVKSKNPDGSLNIYDVQLNTSMVISANDAQHVYEAMY